VVTVHYTVRWSAQWFPQHWAIYLIYDAGFNMVKKIKKTVLQKKRADLFNIPLGKKSFLIFAIGFALIFVGFVVMTTQPWDSTAALYISPIILGVAYFLIFPFGIFAKKKSAKLVSSSDNK